MKKYSLVLAWFALVLACIAAWAFLSSPDAGLSDLPRRNVGPGFSERTTAIFGAALLGWCFSAVGTIIGLLSLAFTGRRFLKLTLTLPAIIFTLTPFFIIR